MKNEINFFIDKQQFKVTVTELTVKQLLEEYAKENSSETTLVLKSGNDLTKLTDLNQSIELKNGMKFFVYHNEPTPVSNGPVPAPIYGPARMVAELKELGYAPEQVQARDENQYVVLKEYVIELGRFAGRVIDLAFLATADFPRTVASAIHIRANPQLYEKSDSVQNVRNITNSGLGPEWRYWSKNFCWNNERSMRRLLSQINTIFETA